MKKIAMSEVALRHEAGQPILDMAEYNDIPHTVWLTRHVEIHGETRWVYPATYKGRWWTDKGEIFPKEIVLIIHQGRPHVVLYSFFEEDEPTGKHILVVAPLEAFDLTA